MATSDDPEWTNAWLSGASLDDQLWLQAMLTERVHQERRLRAQDDPSFTYDLTLGSLIQRGVSDALSDNCEHIASTRAMRHSAAIGNRLWMLVDQERERVGLSSYGFDPC